MNELPLSEVEVAIEKMHGFHPILLRRVEVREQFSGRSVWEGEVLIFSAAGGSPKCYAWSTDGRVTAVLHGGPVDSPEAAVRAAITAEHRRA